MYLLIIAAIVLGVVLYGQTGAITDFNFWALLTEVILPSMVWTGFAMGGLFLAGGAVAAIGTMSIGEVYRRVRVRTPKVVAFTIAYSVGLGGWLT